MLYIVKKIFVYTSWGRRGVKAQECDCNTTVVGSDPDLEVWFISYYYLNFFALAKAAAYSDITHYLRK